MIKFNKVFDVKIIALTISISFLFTATGLTFLSNDCDSLRIPIGQKSTYGRIIEKMNQGVSLDKPSLVRKEFKGKEKDVFQERLDNIQKHVEDLRRRFEEAKKEVENVPRKIRDILETIFYSIAKFESSDIYSLSNEREALDKMYRGSESPSQEILYLFERNLNSMEGLLAYTEDCFSRFNTALQRDRRDVVEQKIQIDEEIKRLEARLSAAKTATSELQLKVSELSEEGAAIPHEFMRRLQILVNSLEYIAPRSRADPWVEGYVELKNLISLEDYKRFHELSVGKQRNLLLITRKYFEKANNLIEGVESDLVLLQPFFNRIKTEWQSRAQTQDRKERFRPRRASSGLTLQEAYQEFGLNRTYLLGHTREAALQEAKKTYKKLARQHHPDLKPEHEREVATKKIKRINLAFEGIVKDIENNTSPEAGGLLFGEIPGADMERRIEPFDVEKFIRETEEGIKAERIASEKQVLASALDLSTLAEQIGIPLEHFNQGPIPLMMPRVEYEYILEDGSEGEWVIDTEGNVYIPETWITRGLEEASGILKGLLQLAKLAEETIPAGIVVILRDTEIKGPTLSQRFAHGEINESVLRKTLSTAVMFEEAFSLLLSKDSQDLHKLTLLNLVFEPEAKWIGKGAHLSRTLNLGIKAWERLGGFVLMHEGAEAVSHNLVKLFFGNGIPSLASNPTKARAALKEWSNGITHTFLDRLSFPLAKEYIDKSDEVIVELVYQLNEMLAEALVSAVIDIWPETQKAYTKQEIAAQRWSFYGEYIEKVLKQTIAQLEQPGFTVDERKLLITLRVLGLAEATGFAEDEHVKQLKNALGQLIGQTYVEQVVEAFKALHNQVLTQITATQVPVTATQVPAAIRESI